MGMQKAGKGEISINRKVVMGGNIKGLLYISIISTQKTRFQCSDVFRKPRYGKRVHEYSLLSVKTCNKQSQQMLRTSFLQKEQKKCIIINKNIKGHFVILVLCFLFHSINTATAQPLSKAQKTSCVHCSPIGTDNRKKSMNA